MTSKELTITGYCFVVSSKADFDYDYDTAFEFSEHIQISISHFGNQLNYNDDSKHLEKWCEENGLDYQCVAFEHVIKL